VHWAQRAINLPFAWYFWPVMAVLVWTSAQYTGYWEDYAVFAICCAVGVAMRGLKLSRAAFIIGFALSDQLEKIWYQYHMLYGTWDFASRPIAMTLCVLAITVTVWGLFFNRSRISYV
jgi:TctA family transporter